MTTTCLVLAACGFVSFAWQVFQASSHQDSTWAELSLFVGVMFSLFAILAWLIGRSLRYANIQMDTDGIWFSHLNQSQDSTTWHDVASIKETAVSEKILLLNQAGNSLMRIDKNLNDIETFINMVMANTAHYNGNRRIPYTLSSRMHHILLMPILAAGYLLVEGALPAWGVKDILILGSGLFFLYLYLSRPYAATMQDKALVLSYPNRKKTIPLSAIETVEKKQRDGAISPYAITLTFNNGRKPMYLKLAQLDHHNRLYFLLTHTYRVSRQ